jgi:hypothetical protein
VDDGCGSVSAASHWHSPPQGAHAEGALLHLQLNAEVLHLHVRIKTAYETATNCCRSTGRLDSIDHEAPADEAHERQLDVRICFRAVVALLAAALGVGGCWEGVQLPFEFAVHPFAIKKIEAAL